MNDKRNYIKITLTALAIISIIMLIYVLSPIPELNLAGSPG